MKMDPQKQMKNCIHRKYSLPVKKVVFQAKAALAHI